MSCGGQKAQTLLKYLIKEINNFLTTHFLVNDKSTFKTNVFGILVFLKFLKDRTVLVDAGQLILNHLTFSSAALCVLIHSLQRSRNVYG